MPTTVRLTDEGLADLQQLTKQSDPAEALRVAMYDYVRYARTKAAPLPYTAGRLSRVARRRVSRSPAITPVRRTPLTANPSSDFNTG